MEIPFFTMVLMALVIVCLLIVVIIFLIGRGKKGPSGELKQAWAKKISPESAAEKKVEKFSPKSPPQKQQNKSHLSPYDESVPEELLSDSDAGKVTHESIREKHLQGEIEQNEAQKINFPSSDVDVERIVEMLYPQTGSFSLEDMREALIEEGFPPEKTEHILSKLYG